MTQILPYPGPAHEVEQRWQSARTPFADFLREMRGHPAVRADLSQMFLRAPVPARTSERTVELAAGPGRS